MIPWQTVLSKYLGSTRIKFAPLSFENKPQKQLDKTKYEHDLLISEFGPYIDTYMVSFSGDGNELSRDYILGINENKILGEYLPTVILRKPNGKIYERDLEGFMALLRLLKK